MIPLVFLDIFIIRMIKMKTNTKKRWADARRKIARIEELVKKFPIRESSILPPIEPQAWEAEKTNITRRRLQKASS